VSAFGGKADISLDATFTRRAIAIRGLPFTIRWLFEFSVIDVMSSGRNWSASMPFFLGLAVVLKTGANEKRIFFSGPDCQGGLPSLNSSPQSRYG